MNNMLGHFPHKYTEKALYKTEIGLVRMCGYANVKAGCYGFTGADLCHSQPLMNCVAMN